MPPDTDSQSVHENCPETDPLASPVPTSKTPAKRLLDVLSGILAVFGAVVAIAALVATFTGHLKTIVTDLRNTFADTSGDTSADPPQVSQETDANPEAPQGARNYVPFKSGNDAARHLTNINADPTSVRSFFGAGGKGIWVFATRTFPNPHFKFEYQNVPAPKITDAVSYDPYFKQQSIIPIGFAVDVKKITRLYYFQTTPVTQAQ